MQPLADRFSLWMLGAMACVPFLVPVHTNPTPTFFPEWVACALGLLASPVLFSRAGSVQWPRIAYLLVLLVAVLLMQVVGDRLPYRETGLLAMLYLLWAALVMTIAATLKERLGMVVLSDHLAMWILVGALANAAVGLLASSGYRSGWIMPLVSTTRIYGNLAQPNDFALHLFLGLASALYLVERRRLSTASIIAACCILLPAVHLSGSRTSFLVAAWLATIALLRRKPGSGKQIMIVVLGFIGIGLAATFMQWNGAFSRLAESSFNAETRIQHLRTGLDMFLESPWLGAGFGSFGWESFIALERTSVPEFADHAHNLIVQLLAELGLFAALATSAAIAWWGARLYVGRDAEASGWIAGIAGMVLIHSMLEFPLWRAYFLGLFAVVLALGDERRQALHLGRTPVAAAVLLGSVAAILLLRDYSTLQQILRSAHGGGSAAQVRQLNLRLLALRNGSLLKPDADMALVSTILPTRERLADKLALCRLSLRYYPTNPATFTCALLHELAGSTEEGRRIWHLANAAFPNASTAYAQNARKLLPAADFVRLVPFMTQVGALGPDSP